MSYIETFKEEALELLNELENALLELEEYPDDSELIARVFRALHTIKGASGIVGLDDIVSFTHNIEAIYDFVRIGKIKITNQLISITLLSQDIIKRMVEGEDCEKDEIQKVIDDFNKFYPDEINIEDNITISDENDAVQIKTSTETKTYRIRFKPSQNIISTGTNPILLLNELRTMGQANVIAYTDEIPTLDSLDPQLCYLFWDVILTTDRDENSIRDVFIFVEDGSSIKIDIIENSYDDNEGYKRLGEILVEKEDISENELNNVLVTQKKIGEMLVEEKLIRKRSLESALQEQIHIKNIKDNKKTEFSNSSLRVSSEKLDKLVDLVGELVTVQARLEQYSKASIDTNLISISEDVARLISELRENAMGIRMLQIGTTFSKFKRVVRDLSKNLNKDVVLTTEGGETELDKTVIERLNDPMIHIIRNCIDHGIELPEEREKLGKSRQGHVHLSASHSGGNVIIKIIDDGKGLDSEAIRQKAISKSMISPDTEISEKEIYSIIFEPGFSTAIAVTDVSGRGVGMDVVKQSIESLSGSIEITSKRNEGTSITLRLPLTLAIIDGLLVDIGGDRYIMPLSVVEECIKLSPEAAAKAKDRNMISFRGNVMPYINLRDVFQIINDPPEIHHVVIVEANGKSIGLGVDRLVGQNQTVIKTLNKVYQDIKSFSGATILGDGTIALILDVNQIVSSMTIV